MVNKRRWLIEQFFRVLKDARLQARRQPEIATAEAAPQSWSRSPPRAAVITIQLLQAREMGRDHQPVRLAFRCQRP